MTQIIKDKITKIRENGFALFQNILSKDEIHKLRQIVKDYFNNKGVNLNKGLTQPNAAVEFPEISWLFYHPKLIEIMTQLMEQKQIMFTSHCDLHHKTLSAWHKDDGMTVMDGGYFEQETYDDKECRVYKVAVYLQDHYHNHGGLTVRQGSHKFASLQEGEEVYLQSKAGDLVIFDVRLTHTGQRDLIPLPQYKKQIDLLKRANKKLFKIEPQQTETYVKSFYDNLVGDRLSVFFTYGVPNQHTINFAINNMKRQLTQNQNTNILLPQSVREEFLKRNILLAEDYFDSLKLDMVKT